MLQKMKLWEKLTGGHHKGGANSTTNGPSSTGGRGSSKEVPSAAAPAKKGAKSKKAAKNSAASTTASSSETSAEIVQPMPQERTAPQADTIPSGANAQPKLASSAPTTAGSSRSAVDNVPLEAPGPPRPPGASLYRRDSPANGLLQQAIGYPGAHRSVLQQQQQQLQYPGARLEEASISGGPPSDNNEHQQNVERLHRNFQERLYTITAQGLAGQSAAGSEGFSDQNQSEFFRMLDAKIAQGGGDLEEEEGALSTA